MKTSEKSPPRDIFGFFKNFTYLANDIINITKTSCTMKRNPFFLLLATCLFFAACESGSDNSGQDDPLKITAYEAVQVATEGIALLPASTTTTDRRVDPNKVKTCSSTTAGKLFYVVNFADNAGFAVVRAARNAGAQLLAIVESGNFTPGNTTGNPSFDNFAALLINYLTAAANQTATASATAATRSEWTSVGPYLSVKWGQDAPYNTYCLTKLEGVASPQPCPAGSSVTAVAQIMSYYSCPVELPVTFISNAENEYTYTGIDANLNLDWVALKQYNVGNGIADATGKTLAVLFREIGELSGTKYDIDGSSTSIGNTTEALKALGYAGTLNSYDWQVVREELDNQRLVFMGGSEDDFTQGSSWVVDGYAINAGQANGNYIHINWGAEGYNNGYYLADVFNTSSKYTGASYNYKSQTITGISIAPAN